MAADKKSKRSRRAASTKRASGRASKKTRPATARGGSKSRRKDADAEAAKKPSAEELVAAGKGGPAESPAPPEEPLAATEPPPSAEPSADVAPSGPSTGELKFGANIITEIAVREVSEVDGVAELTGGWRTKGVQVTEVEGEEGAYVLDVRVAVEYGVNCVALADTIRNRIADAIGQMTGQTARAINVHVTGIRDKGHREEPHEEGVPLGEEHGIDF